MLRIGASEYRVVFKRLRGNTGYCDNDKMEIAVSSSLRRMRRRTVLLRESMRAYRYQSKSQGDIETLLKMMRENQEWLSYLVK